MEVKGMPNIKSAKKRVEVIAVKTLQNKMVKSRMRTVIKKFVAAVEAGDKEAAAVAYKVAVKTVDQVAAKGIIHKNAAAHKKSQFTKKLNAMG
jgi:small subunit ribosomal protein S20